jgi:hypothetical protein
VLVAAEGADPLSTWRLRAPRLGIWLRRLEDRGAVQDAPEEIRFARDTVYRIKGCRGLFSNDRNLQNRLPIFCLFPSKQTQTHTTKPRTSLSPRTPGPPPTAIWQARIEQFSCLGSYKDDACRRVLPTLDARRPLARELKADELTIRLAFDRAPVFEQLEIS